MFALFYTSFTGENILAESGTITAFTTLAAVAEELPMLPKCLCL